MKHDFSNEAISAFKSSISLCRTQIKDMRLSSEHLSFPLKNGIIYSILNIIEVDSVNKLPDLLGAAFSQCEIMLDAVHAKIEYHDTENAAKLSETISDINVIHSMLTSILSSLSNADLEKNACFDRLKVDSCFCSDVSKKGILKPIYQYLSEFLLSEEFANLGNNSYLEHKVNEIKDVVNSDEGLWDKTLKISKLVSEIKGPIASLKSDFEFLINDSVDFPAVFGGVMQFTGATDKLTKIFDGIYKYCDGYSSGDIETMMEGASKLKKGLKTTNVFNGAKTSDGKEIKLSVSDSAMFDILWDYAINLSDNYTEGIYKYYTGELKDTKDVLVYIGLECDKDTFDSLVYGRAKNISAIFGYDLDSAYSEIVPGDSGAEKFVNASVKLHEEIKSSGGYWDNWKSGMTLIGNRIFGN